MFFALLSNLIHDFQCHAEEVGHGICHDMSIDFCHVTSDQLFVCLCRMNIQKTSVVVGLHGDGGGVTMTHNGFVWLGKH